MRVDGTEREFEETVERRRPGYLEVVYHLYSMHLKHGPVILRFRTEDRTDRVHLPSLTPIWRGAEFQEREIFDLYGIIFDGHPDLRRILMWDGFEDHPMRKDYVEPDDYEYEPTAHDRPEKAKSTTRLREATGVKRDVSSCSRSRTSNIQTHRLIGIGVELNVERFRPARPAKTLKAVDNTHSPLARWTYGEIEIKERLEQRPFRPFKVRVAGDGNTGAQRRPRSSAPERASHVYSSGTGGTAIIDVPHVTSIHVKEIA